MPKHKQGKFWYYIVMQMKLLHYKKHVYVDHCMIAKTFEEELNKVWSQSNEPIMIKKLKDSNIFSDHFHFFIKRTRWNPLQYIKLKIHMIFSIHHIFCINFWWITNFFCKSVQILPNSMFCCEKLS